MGTAVIDAAMGDAGPLDAAARFHADVLPRVRAALADADSVVVRFDHAPDKPHGWRREAIAALAREAAPRRVNAVAPGPDGGDTAQAVSFCHQNLGVTGQLLIVSDRPSIDA